MVGDCSVQQCREKCLSPAQNTVSSSLWWLMMLSSGAHGMFPMLPLGVTTITWSFQHWILAAVGFAVPCPLWWDQQRRQSPTLPRDAGGLGVCLCPGLVQPAYSTYAKTGCIAHSINGAERLLLPCLLAYYHSCKPRGLLTAKKASMSHSLAVRLTSP